MNRLDKLGFAEDMTDRAEYLGSIFDRIPESTRPICGLGGCGNYVDVEGERCDRCKHLPKPRRRRRRR